MPCAEVGDAVRDRAPALPVHALWEEAVHVRLVVEHEVLPELAARVAEDGAARSGGEEAEARRLDRARGQDEGVGRHALPFARAVDVLDPAHVPAVVHQPAGLRVEAELAAAGEQRAPERGHRGRALGVVRAAEAAAQAAVDARRPLVVEARVDGRGIGVRVEGAEARERHLASTIREQEGEVHRHAGRHGVGLAARRLEDVVALLPLHAVEPLGLDVEGLQVGVGERPVGEVRGLDVEAGHVEARGGGDERVDRRFQPEVDRIEARRFRVGMLEGAAHRLGEQVHVRVDGGGAHGVAAERARLEEGVLLHEVADRVLELVVAVQGQGKPRRVVEARERVRARLQHEHVLARSRQHVRRRPAAGAAPDDAEVEAGEAVVPEDLVFRLAAGHAQSVPKMRVKAMIVSWTLLAAALIGRGPLTSSGLGVDMGWSGRSL